MNLSNLPIIDCHVHVGDVEAASLFLSIMRRAGFKRMNLLSIISLTNVNFNPEVMYMKAIYPDYFYIFGGLDYSSTLIGFEEEGSSLKEQIDTMIEIGFDGVKMVEGKPIARKYLKIPFDSKFYKDYFEYLESLQYPLLFHVNDPEEFWDPERIPQRAKERGWYYDETYPTREDLYREVKNVLENCPNLKVIFAHFYFLSDNLERVSNLLERYKNVHLDITPGPEMYYDFSAKRDEWRRFFIQYQDRILYGTDINDRMTLEMAVNHANRIRKFLETEEPIFWGSYPTKSEPLQGFRLPDHVLGKIYAENFERIVGKKPRSINLEAAIKECERLARIVAKIRGKRKVTATKWMRTEKHVENPAEYVAKLLKEMS